MMINRANRRNTLSAFFSAIILFVLVFLSIQVIAEAKNGTTGLQAPADTELKPQIGRMGDPIGVDPATFKFSSAEKEIWLEDHLKNVDKPARLYYEFIRDGSYDEGFTDAVYLDIVKLNKDGTKNVTLDFFSGERRQRASPDNLNHVRGNPVIGIYMQGDVMEMNRLTKGSWRYFQRQIKFAISGGADIQPVSIKFAGKEVQGEKITIRPYVKDPHRRQFADFAGKRYDFIFSRDIPGTLYQISTVIPAKKGSGDQPLIRETLTLQNVEYRG